MSKIELTAVFEPCDKEGYLAYIKNRQNVNCPRHSNIKENLCRKICKDLGIQDILKETNEIG